MHDGADGVGLEGAGAGDGVVHEGHFEEVAQGWWCCGSFYVDPLELGIGPLHDASGEEDEDEGGAARDAEGDAEAEFGNE